MFLSCPAEMESNLMYEAIIDYVVSKSQVVSQIRKCLSFIDFIAEI